jgi:pilus assembly protein CpaB
MGRRTLLVIASILVAAVGTAMIWAYVSSADARARENWRLVDVLTATAAIPAGTPVGSLVEQVELSSVPAKVAPTKRITSLAQVAGQSTTVPILAGQYLVQGQFTADIASAVPENRMGVGIELGDPQRVAGLLHPGSRVAIYWLPVAGGSGSAGDGGKTAAPSGVQLLLPEVTVLALGDTTVIRDKDGVPAQEGTQGGVSTGLVTLDVVGPQATRLLLAQHTGSVWFTVLGKGAKGQQSDAVSADKMLSLAGG